MNRKQLEKLGVPDDAVPEAIKAIQSAANQGIRGKEMQAFLQGVVANPAGYIADDHFADLARQLMQPDIPVRHAPVPYRTWGGEYIDESSHHQMREACSLPHAVGAALMPDAHVGYGLPIGGVLALEGAVCPYAVGVDIACRMKLTVLDVPVERLEDERNLPDFRNAIENGTLFGTGKSFKKRHQHDVMDQDWSVSRVTRENKDKAWSQMGTSGSGNHFVEFGTLTIAEPELGLPAGNYVSLLSHSGSRGAGHAVCSTYSAIAQKNLPRQYRDFGRLAWLDLETQAGQEYWAAMNLMGDYASANHAIIHQSVSKLLGAETLATVENHHNFAWKETHLGKEVIVHRKGATPAGEGVLGVIPGSMATPAYVVRGKGNAESFHSASHGAGRQMSRTKANSMFRFNAVRGDLKKKGITVLSAGSDEVPGVYKNIDDIMAAQQDLVDIVARFDPRIVKMCGDGSKAED
ncbi:RtcB family protein [Planctomicrobium piriforme]|uniref:3'-phosphate/5'-hydroxy nucleic acid ligase n=1 Tax=Planctomicrobium piriforme TaxID=1576369 RepID=A0A1I3C5Q9_9PLAN|nr:RtcB family protein [Planctomicrobium piriforme]SFH69753.1 tRNA-splicing ligase RtcB [Planctomicrobium piriforme]